MGRRHLGVRRGHGGGGGDQWVEVPLTSGGTPINATGATVTLTSSTVAVGGANTLTTTDAIGIPYPITLPEGIAGYAGIVLRLGYAAGSGSLLDSTGMKFIGCGIQPLGTGWADGILGVIQKDTTNWRLAAFTSGAALSNAAITGPDDGIMITLPFSPDGLREHLLMCTYDSATKKPVITTEYELAGSGVVSATCTAILVVGRTATAGALSFEGVSLAYKLISRA